MKPTILLASSALVLGLLAGCDRAPEESARANTTTQTGSAASGGTATQQSNTPSTPANVGAGATDEGKQPPVQGREDVRQPEQRKDFQQRGDGAGPKPN
jgi:hypothetical protein